MPRGDGNSLHSKTVNVSSPLPLLLTQCTYIYTHTHTHTYIYIYTHIYINYMPIHAYIIPIHIYAHKHAHTSIYVHLHTCIAVHVYITFHLLMEGGMVRVYRILRVMPQPAINITKICFVTNYGKSRNYNFLNNNILYHLLGGIYGPQKDEHQDARISPQATTPVTIKY